MTTITHMFQAFPINQRISDRYLDATEMARACGKRVNDYKAIASSKAYLDCLADDLGMSVDKIFEILAPHRSWIHPLAAIHFAQWLSPACAVWASKVVARYEAGETIITHSKRKALDVEDLSKVMDGFERLANIPSSTMDDQTKSMIKEAFRDQMFSFFREQKKSVEEEKQAEVLCKKARIE